MESMTGYGRGSAQSDGRELTIELKAVNHRYLDLSFRTPRSIAFLEDLLRTCIQQGGIRRGHIDVSVNYTNRREDARAVTVDENVLHGFNQAIQHAHKLLKDHRRLSVAEALTLSGALSVEQAEENREAVMELACRAAQDAVNTLQKMRQREGEMLARDLLENLSALEAVRQEIAARAPLVPEEYRQRLSARLDEWQAAGTEPQRVAQEVALMADRCAIDEELSRLSSHIAQFGDTVTGETEAGKKLDFLLQEMNREVNTIGSKASDAAIAQTVVKAKCIIEKLREQVQNAA